MDDRTRSQLNLHHLVARPWWLWWRPARCTCRLRWSRCQDAREAETHAQRPS